MSETEELGNLHDEIMRGMEAHGRRCWEEDISSPDEETFSIISRAAEDYARLYAIAELEKLKTDIRPKFELSGTIYTGPIVTFDEIDEAVRRLREGNE